MVVRKLKYQATVLPICLLLFSLCCISPVASANQPLDKDSSQAASADEQAWLAENHLVRVRVGYVPPFHFYQDGFQGIAVDYMNAIAKRAGFRVEYVTNIPWSDAFQNLINHEKIDLLLSAKITPERQEYAAFTDEYLFSPMVIFTRRDSPFVSSIDDLADKTIVVERGYVVQKQLVVDYPAIKLQLEETTKAALNALATGGGDAYVGNLLIGTYLIETNGYSNIKVAAPTRYESHNQAMAVRQDWPQLTSIINKTLQTFTPDEHAAIRNIWMSPVRYEYGISREEILEWVLGTAAVSLTIIGIILFRNKRLRKEITARENAEMRLRGSEERVRTIFEQAPLGIALVESISGRIIEVNPRFAEIIGRSREEIVDIDWMSITHPDDMQEDLATMALFNAGKIPRFTMEKRYLKPDGSSVWINMTIARFNIDNTVTAQHLCMIEDIAVRRQLEEKLRHAQKMEAIGTLAGGIAHDFNNLLAIIQGNTQMAQHKLPEESKVKANLERVIEATNRAVGLVKQVLTFSRRHRLALVPLDLTSLVGTTLQMLHTTLPSRLELKHSFDKDSAAMIINADANQLQQMLINLSTNAIDAMQNEGQLTVSLQTIDLADADLPVDNERQPGTYIRLSVSDTGIGISKENIEKIFDPFFSTKKAGAGTGMGLAVVHGIVKDHDGLITVDSEPGVGSTFNIYFPSIAGTALGAQAEISREMPVGTERVLLVDDEEALVKSNEEMLITQGYKVVGTTSSKEALSIFTNQPEHFNLVITDQTMPEMLGTELAAELLKIRAEIPIILCSGYSGRVTAKAAKALGIREFCMKPLSHLQLTQVVRRVLDEDAG